MTISNRSKFGLVLMSIAIICIAYTWIKFDEAKKSAAEDDVEVDHHCVGHLDTLIDPVCWSVVPTGDFGLGACCIGICSMVLASLLLLGGWMSFLFGLGQKEESVDMVPAPSSGPSMDEFADLERELDGFE